MKIFPYRLLLLGVFWIFSTLGAELTGSPRNETEPYATELSDASEFKQIIDDQAKFEESIVEPQDEQPKGLDIQEVLRLVCQLQQEWYAKQQKHRQEMLQQLAEETQQAVRAAEKSYVQVIDLLNIAFIVKDHCEVVLKDCERLKIEDEMILQHFSNLFAAIEQGSFDKLLYGGVSHDYLAAGFSPEKLIQGENGFDFEDLMGAFTGKRKTISQDISREELGDLIDRLRVVRKEYNDQLEESEGIWDACLQLLDAIYDKKVYKAALKAFDALKPSVQEARNKLNHALQLLKEEQSILNDTLVDDVCEVNEGEAESSDAEKVIVETPIAFWEKQLYGHKRKMNSLYWLTAGVATDSFELSELLFKCASYGHSIARDFLQLYDRDIHRFQQHGNFTGSRTPLDIEMFVVRPLLGLWNFFNMRSQVIGQVASFALNGQLPHGQIDYPQLLLLNAVLVPISMKTLPYLYGDYKSKTQKVIERVSVAWMYYHALHCYQFERESCYFSQVPVGNGLQAGRFWPNHNPYMIDAVSYALREGQEYCGYKLAQYLATRMDPETLDDLEQYSLGVIKPDLIPFVIRVAFPFVIHNMLPASVRNIAEFRQVGHPDVPYGDLYNWISWMNIPPFMQMFVMRNCYNLSMGTPILRSTNRQAFYVESQIYFYLLASVGGHCGGRFAVHYRDAVASLLRSTAQTCVSMGSAVGLLGDEVAHEINESLVDGFALMIDQLREGMASLFISSSKARGMAKSYLINKGRLTGEETNEFVISQEILAAGLTLLTQARLLRYAQAASLMQLFGSDPTNTGAVIDKLINELLENGIRFVGESAGSVSAQMVGGFLWNKYGPFISPRIP